MEETTRTRPGAKVSQGLRDSFWLQGMVAGHEAVYDCTKRKITKHSLAQNRNVFVINDVNCKGAPPPASVILHRHAAVEGPKNKPERAGRKPTPLRGAPRMRGLREGGESARS